MNSSNSGRFAFADEESMKIAADAALRVIKGQRGAYLVVGPPCSGKTAFISGCLSQRFVRPHGAQLPKGERQRMRRLFELMPRGYIWFDDVSGKINSMELQYFVTSTMFDARPKYARKYVSRRNDCVVFLSGTNVMLGPDLARCFQVI